MPGIVTKCAGCGGAVQLREDFVGKLVRCPLCQEVFRATLPGTSLASETVPAPTASHGIQSEAPAPRTMPIPQITSPLHDDSDEPIRRQGSRHGRRERVGRPLRECPPNQIPGSVLAIVQVVFEAFLLLASISVVPQLFSQESLLIEFTQRPVDAIMAQRAERNDAALIVAGVVRALLLCVAIVLFLIWIYRAHANLQRFQLERLEFTPGWTVGYFFIPFANLVYPYRAMQEIWKGSSSETPPDDSEAWQDQPGSKLVIYWWVAYLLNNFAWLASNAFDNAAKAAPTIPTLIAVTRVAIVVCIVQSVYSTLTIILVLRTRSRQIKNERRWQEAEEEG